LFDKATGEDMISGFILVAADFSTPAGSSWYVNSPATGNWEDFLVRELVPHIDGNYRTIAHRDSRGLLGDGVGGYGAIRLGMRHPGLFGVVYAMQAVGTGASLQATHSRANFDLLARAATLEDLGDDHFSRIFTSIYQAFSPNAQRPPFYFDPPIRQIDGRAQVDSQVLAQFHARFGLAGLVPTHAEQLRSLRALKFDWGRSDTLVDHIHGSQILARQLTEYGVPHEAEEHSGGFRDRHWGEQGRVYTDVLPFFARHLVFAPDRPKQ
jgi:S-formylglutathione hydrolase FrmB